MRAKSKRASALLLGDLLDVEDIIEDAVDQPLQTLGIDFHVLDLTSLVVVDPHVVVLHFLALSGVWDFPFPFYGLIIA